MFTLKQLIASFIYNYLLGSQHENDGIIDSCARCEDWNNYTDFLCKNGDLPISFYNEMAIPDFLEETPPIYSEEQAERIINKCFDFNDGIDIGWYNRAEELLNEDEDEDEDEDEE